MKCYFLIKTFSEKTKLNENTIISETTTEVRKLSFIEMIFI